MPRARGGLIVGIVIGLLVAAIFASGFAAGSAFTRSQPSAGSDQNLSDFLSAYRLVTQQSYYRPLNRGELVHAAIDGMLAATGDPHTLYLSPDENQVAGKEINGSGYAGIGAIVVPLHGNLQIQAALPHSPASEAGLRSGDLVTRIDGTPVAAMSGDAAIARIHGKAGTRVRLTLRRGGQRPFTMAVQRARIPAITAYGRSLPHHLAYVQIFSFGDSTAKEVASALMAARASHVRGIVLDLRGNPGGYVDAAQETVSEFLSSGVVAYEKSSDGHLTALNVLPGKEIIRAPVAVLVDADTASAAEITAAALRDDARAVLVGTRTYGKGSMQSVYTLKDGSSVRITDRLWLTPLKQSIQKVGIRPSVVVRAGTAGQGDDPQLTAAENQLVRGAGR